MDQAPARPVRLTLLAPARHGSVRVELLIEARGLDLWVVRRGNERDVAYSTTQDGAIAAALQELDRLTYQLVSLTSY